MATGEAADATFGKLIVTIKSAHSLKDKAFIGKANPYVVVKLSDAEIQTHHIKNAGESAVWDESFAFNNVSPTDNLVLSVYDHKLVTKDAHMGTGSVGLTEAFEEGQYEARVPLTDKSGKAQAGEVWITLRTEGVKVGGETVEGLAPIADVPKGGDEGAAEAGDEGVAAQGAAGEPPGRGFAKDLPAEPTPAEKDA